MLIALWSPKGGSGTSVLAASLALVIARDGPARVPARRSRRRPTRDLRARRRTRARSADWLAAGPEAPVGGARPPAVEAAPGVALLPLGGRRRRCPGGPKRWPAPRWRLRSATARYRSSSTVVARRTRRTRAVAEVADARVAVVRGCYLALRRAVQSPVVACTGGGARRRAGAFLGPS